MADGTLGLNATDFGISRDNLVAYDRRLGGRFLLARNSPDLVNAAGGGRAVYRQLGDQTLDIAPELFADIRIDAAPNALYIHGTNELDPTPELLAWTRRFMLHVLARGRIPVIFNFSTHRSAPQWALCLPLIREAVALGVVIGFHVYLHDNLELDAGAWTWLPIQQQVGGLWMCTEFAWYVDAYHGYLAGGMKADFFARFLPRFARLGIAVFLFSWEHWPLGAEGARSGFGILDDLPLQVELVTLNRLNPLEDTPPMTLPIGKSKDALLAFSMNLRATPRVAAALLRTLVTETPVRWYPDSQTKLQDGYVWLQVSALDLFGWMAWNTSKAPQLVDQFKPLVPIYPDGTLPLARRVLVDQLALRDQPGLDTEVLLRLPRESVVVVYGAPQVRVNDLQWARVETPAAAGWSALDVGGGEPSFGDLAPSGFHLLPPFKQSVISSHFDAPRSYPFAPTRKQLHEGLDVIDGLASANGSDPMIHAGADGVVLDVAWQEVGYGHYVILNHGAGRFTWYCHLAEPAYVKIGESVKAGRILGLMGMTGGTSTGPHCHITCQWFGHGAENYVVSDVVDPERLLLRSTTEHREIERRK